MPIEYFQQQGISFPQGFASNAVACGIKETAQTKLDLALIYSKNPCTIAGVFTTNQIKAHPVIHSQQVVAQQQPIHAIVANSGNANACTGQKGAVVMTSYCNNIAKLLSIDSQQIAICSTGVIGIPPLLSRIENKLPQLIEGLSTDTSGEDVAKAIMTSDTSHKQMASSITTSRGTIRLGICAKGAGMICPNMATMLSFITTDAAIEQTLLQQCLQQAIEQSFNCISIDGDMSTNDTVLLLSNGASNITITADNTALLADFQQALNHLTKSMAQALVKDGERVTKFITLEIVGATSRQDAKKIAYAIANSALVKCSWNGEDPNWGRIIHAIGYANAAINPNTIDIYVNDVISCQQSVESSTDREILRQLVCNDQFTIRVDLNLGQQSFTVYTNDLSPEYVDFNRSEYAYWQQKKQVNELT